MAIDLPIIGQPNWGEPLNAALRELDSRVGVPGPKGDKGDPGEPGKDGTVTPEMITLRDESVAAKNTTVAAREAAVTAKDDAVAAKVAAQAVGATNDAIMAGVAADPASAFFASLGSILEPGIDSARTLTRSLLVPQNLYSRPRTVHSVGFFGEAGHGWTAGSGDIDLNDTTQSLLGQQSIRLSGASTTAHVQRTPISAFSIRGTNIKLAFRLQGDVKGIVIYFSSDAGFVNRVQRQAISLGQHIPGEDHMVSLPAGMFTPTGSPDIDKLVFCRILVNFGPGGGTAWLGGLSLEKGQSAPLVTFGFDDSALDHYTKARPKLNKYGFPATLYPTIGSIGRNPDNITIEQVRHLHDVEGWEVGLHAIDSAHHVDHVGKSHEWLRDHFERMLEWNAAQGFLGGTFAWPNTTNDAQARSVAAGYFTASRGGRDAVESLPPSMRTVTAARNVGTTTVGDVKSLIDMAVSGNGPGWVQLFFHRLPVVKSDANDVALADFNEIVDYVAASGAQVVTAAQAMSMAR